MPVGPAVGLRSNLQVQGRYRSPAVILVHGYAANKSDIMPYGAALHDTYNLVAFDLRNGGRSTGAQTTYGVLEQDDQRAVIDWLVREKDPAWIDLLGNSMGAATAPPTPSTRCQSSARVQCW